jgi:hypothetical protein
VVAVVESPHALILAHHRGGDEVLSRTTPHGLFPLQHTFVAQFAIETTPGAMGITERVEHLVSGQAMRFQSVAVLFACMAAWLREVWQTSPGRRPQRGLCKTHCQERR